MLIKKEAPYIEQDCFKYKDNSDDEGELKIDLDYEEYKSVVSKGDNVTDFGLFQGLPIPKQEEKLEEKLE